MMHHLSLSCSRPLSLRLQHSPGVTPGRRVFAWLVTSKCTLHALFVFSPLVAKSISFPFIAPPTSLCHYLSHASLLSYSFPSFSHPPSLSKWIPPAQTHQRHVCLPLAVKQSFTQAGGLHAKARCPQGLIRSGMLHLISHSEWGKSKGPYKELCHTWWNVWTKVG